jgi:hypothetical protein
MRRRRHATSWQPRARTSHRSGEGILERIFDGAEPPVAAEHRRAIASLPIALCDGLILQWLLDRDAVPGSQAMLAALAAVAAESGRVPPAPELRA